MNIPNTLTTLRIVLMVPFIVFFFFDSEYKNWIILGFFILLSLTDILDGYIARKYNMVTRFGKIMDPVADKILVITLLLYLTFIGHIDDWMTIIIFAREILVTIIRVAAIPNGVVVSASVLGKLKALSQMVSIPVVLVFPVIGWYFMFFAVLLTIISGFDYYLKVKRLVPDLGNIPNSVTFVRLLIIPFMAWFIIHSYDAVSLVLMALVVAGDKLDGISAKMSNQVTKFGKVFDNFTDYTLMLTIIILTPIRQFVPLGWLLVFVIPAAIIFVSKVFNYKKKKKYFFPGSFIGKICAGVFYAMFLSFLIDFKYKYWILAFSAVMLYATMFAYFLKVFFPRNIRKEA